MLDTLARAKARDLVPYLLAKLSHRLIVTRLQRSGRESVQQSDGRTLGGDGESARSMDSGRATKDVEK